MLLVKNKEVTDEPTWRCHKNPFIGALGTQEPVIPGITVNLTNLISINIKEDHESMNHRHEKQNIEEISAGER